MALSRKVTDVEASEAKKAVEFFVSLDAKTQADEKASAEVKKNSKDTLQRAQENFKALTEGSVEGEKPAKK